ncbi:diacylglycerol O-acyltransferase 2A [Nannizzia gypsea CBS 118893]|uniref:Diacylglycerol O-acyltransferase n=1 Tax=Arthroderma gypseum (strain ATCC MYA-4604 / CBS 118893) TaxID=535722 RepID=E4UWU2_ARTGP|nr:diacylglycerol O-acyltransferase 2A [Nannizzia gypsea CBS 118893]EFR01795.1 diacylglycerol O-acyltransferase 2A [Nannizzia gypsea CBS 118893]
MPDIDRVFAEMKGEAGETYSGSMRQFRSLVNTSPESLFNDSSSTSSIANGLSGSPPSRRNYGLVRTRSDPFKPNTTTTLLPQPESDYTQRMGYNTMGSVEYQSQTAPSDSRRPTSYHLDRILLDVVLFLLRHSTLLANSVSIRGLHITILQGRNRWKAFKKKQLHPISTHLEAVWLVLPGPPSPNVPLPPTRKYIFGYHPHGIISHGAFAAFATEGLGFSKLFPGITNTLLTLDSNFRLPFYRDWALAMGLGSVSRESCENILSRGGMNKEGMGRAITIVIGGARESLDAQPHTLRLILRRRKGFVKLAIRTGADLVPVLAFGENELYEQVKSDQHPLIHRFQMLLKSSMGFTIPLFHARGVFNYDVGLMPYRRPLNIVVGRPIPVMQQTDRSKMDDAYIDELHEKYIQELEKMWDEWKDTFAPGRISELEIAS